jgi:hypothetical protein
MERLHRRGRRNYMGVLVKKPDVDNQWRRYRAAQAFAVEAGGVFEYAARFAESADLTDEQVQGALELCRRANAVLEREWSAYAKIAPAKMRTKRKAA